MKNNIIKGILASFIAVSTFALATGASAAVIKSSNQGVSQKYILSQKLGGMYAYDSSNYDIGQGNVKRGDKLSVIWNSTNVQVVNILLNTNTGKLVRVVASQAGSRAAHPIVTWTVPKDVAPGSYILWMTSGDGWVTDAVTLNVI